MKVHHPTIAHFDYSPENVDEYAIFVVVWQGTYMNLNPTEKILACYALQDRGWEPVDIADYLRISNRQMYRWLSKRELVAQNSQHPIALGLITSRVEHASLCQDLSDLVSTM